MYLSGLELLGFKSFPKRTKLTFCRGVIAIVGPNGCGKSNLVDAVRWVLGEQRSTALRSEKMENVIFSGTNGRKPMHLGGVTLTIENTLGLLPAEYSEVAITRRLYRNGDSEYLINRRPCRLKDIRTLFADKGLGPDSYSIIELKMVESILSGRPEERRRLFEEAAGVTLYKARLKAAQSRLTATETDLVRLDDVFREVENRRTSLRRQVAKAKRSHDLKEALKAKELKGAAFELADLRAKIAPQQEQLEQDQRRKIELEHNLSHNEKEVAKLRGRLSALELQLAEARKNRSNLSARNQAAQREIARLEERIQSGETQSDQRNQEETELTGRRSAIAEKIEILHAQREDAKTALKKVKNELETIEKKWQEHQSHLHSAKSKLISLEETRTEAEKQLANLEAELSHIQELQRRILQKIETLKKEDQIIVKLPDLEQSRIKVHQQEEALQKIMEDLESARTQLDRARDQRSSARSDLAAVERDLDATQKRVKLLQGIVHEGEGRSKAVKALLNSGIKELVGRLGDAISVEEKWRLAVSSALEDVVSAVVSRSESGILKAADYLKTADHGRGALAFLPSQMKEIAPEKPVFADDSAILGDLLSKVKVKGDARRIVDRYLARVWIAENLEILLKYAPAAIDGGWTLITPDGCRLTPEGILTVGSAIPGDLGSAELLERAIEEESSVSQRVKQFRLQVKMSEKEEKTAEDLVKKLASEQKICSKEYEAKKHELALIESELQTQSVLRERRKIESESLYNELHYLQNQQIELIEQKNSSFMSTQKLIKEAEDATRVVESIEQEGQDWRQSREEILQQKMSKTSIVERLEADVRHQGSMMEELGNRLENLQQARRNALHAQEDAIERLRQVRAEEEVTNQELETTNAQIQESQKNYDNIRTELSEKEGVYEENRTERERLSDKVHIAELKMADLNHRITSVQERILETYHLDLFTTSPDALPDAVSPDNPFLEKSLSELREDLQSIGPVNEMALEEFGEVDARYTLLQEQIDDLTKAKATLEETIHEINTVARERFRQTFERVNAHFCDLFRRLFEGGEASLDLAEGDPLEAGIRIYATPRGKKLGTIELMSGGEKALTAIALLFALYLEKPAPFCFLDEVDAPLDDVNVVRFNHLLREFTDRTQFLVVTHNKLTMEHADRLYGITMEEEGVSRLVTVEIEGRETAPLLEPSTDAESS